LTPPKPTIPRAPEPTSCSSAPPSEPTPVEEEVVETEENVSFEDLEKRIGEWKEIALFLRRNVVQGEQGQDGAFRESSLVPSCEAIIMSREKVVADWQVYE
jgi:hypothetical protein